MDTMERINLEIQSTRAAIAQTKQETTSLDNLLAMQKEYTEAKYIAANNFVKEEREAKELERFTVTSLFASLSGNKAERLEKETREAEVAKAHYEMACRDLDRINERIAALHNNEADVLALEQKLEELLAEKSDFIRTQRIAASAELTALEGEIAKLRDRGSELEEAQKAGNAVIVAIFAMESNLESAKAAGTLDAVGGGFWIGFSKQDHIERAQLDAQNIQNALSNFRTELDDVSIAVNAPTIHLNEFLSLADLLFDNIFVDLAVQKKIRDALAQIAPLRTSVEQAMSRLSDLVQENNEKIAVIEHKREELLSSTT